MTYFIFSGCSLTVVKKHFPREKLIIASDQFCFPPGCVPDHLTSSPSVPASYPLASCKCNWSKWQKQINELHICGCLALKHPEKTPIYTVFLRLDSATVWCNILSELRIPVNDHSTKLTSWDCIMWLKLFPSPLISLLFVFMILLIFLFSWY